MSKAAKCALVQLSDGEGVILRHNHHIAFHKAAHGWEDDEVVVFVEDAIAVVGFAEMVGGGEFSAECAAHFVNLAPCASKIGFSLQAEYPGGFMYLP